MSKKSSIDLTKGSVSKTLLRLMIPMIIGIGAILLFNVVDTIFVGQLGAHELAAMGFTFPVIFTIMSLTMGIGVGTTACISNAIGRNQTQRVKALATHSIFLGLMLVVLLGGIGLVTIDPIFRALGANNYTLPYIHEYMEIWYGAIGLLVVPMLGNSAIRATGDTKTPAAIMIFSGLINLILDPLLIFGWGPFPELGIQGAALATAISWGLTFFASFWVLGQREKMLEFVIPKLKSVLESWKAILYIGLPAAGTNILVPLSTGILTRMVANFGTASVAAFGAGTRIESLSMIGVMGLATALVPFVGQNLGAKKMKRIQTAIQFSFRFALWWGLLAFTLLNLLATPISQGFSNEPMVVEIIKEFLLIIPISYCLFGMANIAGSTFNALQLPLRSASLIVLRLFVFAIPFAYFGATQWAVPGIFVGISAANLAIGLIAYFWLKQTLKKATAS
jgi:putative MATE family efflux protein